ncbi:hypothetical protein E8E12_011264 [Didymella heteroderae]|uniref:Uncharacterized protein n=1 Tax=Didymella heteroderae TaxID=1769908 RepID=A0A9P4X1U7_9PLEO|nr:hypothetical protein E8E12_011264 [Didymella heteroderae]
MALRTSQKDVYDNSSIAAVSGSLSFPSSAYSVTNGTSYSDTATSHDGSIPASGNPSSEPLSYSVTEEASSLDVATVTVVQIQTPSVSTYISVLLSSDASSDNYSEASSALPKSSSLASTTQYPTSSSEVNNYIPSQAPYPYKNITRTITSGTATITTIFRGHCTGCALAALNPVTTSYESDLFGNWTSLVVTETVLTEFVTYLNNATIDTIVTETKTVNQTKTVNGITETAAEFNVYLPSPGLDLTLDVGPTYVLYTSLFGGPDAAVQANATARNNATDDMLQPTSSTCQPHVTSLRGWIPTKTVDWDFFIQTFANGSTPEPTPYDSPVPIPHKLRNFLAQDPEIQQHFQGADINTCSFPELIGDPNRTFNPPPSAAPTSAPAEISVQPTATSTSAPAMTFSPFPTFSSVPGTNTFLKTTYESTSKHITKLGCLRCDTNKGDLPQPQPTSQDPNINNDPAPSNTPNPKNDDSPTSKDNPNNNNGQKTDGQSQDQPHNMPQSPPNSKPDVNTTPSIPDFISSVVSDNPDLTKKPTQQPTDSGQRITIGDSVVTVKPQPTQQDQGGPDQQTNAPTIVIIGTQTVTVGQTTTINGVKVVVDTNGGGSRIIVGDNTITVGPQVTQGPLPVLTVGHSTITANPQGQFVVGTQTLQRGGPMVIVDDNTLTLGPNGKIAIWNGATQTLVTMIGQPAVTFGGESITAKILGGTTVFVVGDKTLGPGDAITVDGTTYSLPPGFHGSSIVINGQITERLSAGLPALTVNNIPITATVADGTTEFILAPGQTLTPGGELVVGGTTYSLPNDGQGSTIVINGATSRLNQLHLPVLPLGSEDATAVIAHGTTAFVFGPDQTLTPGGVVTVSGTTFSLPASASGSVVVINGVTSTLGSGSGMGSITAAPPIVVDGKTITATTRDGTVEYVLNSATTLLPGGQAIIDGTTYSLAPGGTALIINGKTSTLSTPASNSASTTSSLGTTSERGAGDFIASGIGESSKNKGAGSWAHGGGVDKWVENLMIGFAGWLLWLV